MQVYFNTALLIIYVSAIETPICHREIKFNRVYFLRFCSKYDTRFSNIVLNSWCRFLRQMSQLWTHKIFLTLSQASPGF